MATCALPQSRNLLTLYIDFTRERPVYKQWFAKILPIRIRLVLLDSTAQLWHPPAGILLACRKATSKIIWELSGACPVPRALPGRSREAFQECLLSTDAEERRGAVVLEKLIGKNPTV